MLTQKAPQLHQKMKHSNKFNLPETIVRATHRRNAAYNSNADRSATQLIAPPRIDVLRKAHYAEMQKDISEEIFALFGSAVHQILEWGANDGEVSEERLYAKVNGWVISGAMDLQRDDVEQIYSIIDYKVCSVWSIISSQEVKPEWEEQLNIYAWLVWMNKQIAVDRLFICAFIRDWERKKAKSDLTYPPSPIHLIPVPVWSRAKQEEFVHARVRLHQQAVFSHNIGEELPECSAEERWERNGKWKVFKAGGKRALRTFATKEEAEKFASEQDKETTIEHHPGVATRCVENFCGVNKWCSQFQRMNSGNEPEKEEEGE